MRPELDREKLETLDGSRNRASLPRAAVRIEDLTALLALPATSGLSKAMADPPTKAEYDRLVDAVDTLHRRLAEVARALQSRILP